MINTTVSNINNTTKLAILQRKQIPNNNIPNKNNNIINSNTIVLRLHVCFVCFACSSFSVLWIKNLRSPCWFVASPILSHAIVAIVVIAFVAHEHDTVVQPSMHMLWQNKKHQI